MRLVTKLTIWYLAITTMVLIAGGYFVFKSVGKEVYSQDVRRLRNLLRDAEKKLHAGVLPEKVSQNGIVVKELEYQQPVLPFQVSDKMVWHSSGEKTERQMQAVISYKINKKHFLIQASSFVVENKDIADGVINSVKWLFIILLVFVIIAGTMASKYVLSPFNLALGAIQQFTLQQEKAIVLPHTSTQEFTELNQFLQKMTVKALDDYKSLKEFTENASHELQTPLAVMRAKMDLLIESEINNEQAELLTSLYDSVKKLSKINESLIFLAKLENMEYRATEILTIGDILQKAVFSFDEMIEMKAITIETEIEEDMQVKINPILADILLGNLLTNAIRHNFYQGSIHIILANSKLIIKNTGVRPNVPVNELFQRFKKSDQSAESIGLGLSIVKQIAEINHFQLEYNYANGIHTVQVGFKQQ